MELFFVSIICFLTLYLSAKVFNNPSLAFPVILGLGIFFQDLRFTQLQIENKVILLAVVFSLFCARKKQRKNNFNFQLSQNKFHETIFLLLIFYLIAQSIRGSFAYWRGVGSFYWVAQFLVIGYIGAKSFAGKYIFPTNDLIKVVKSRSFIIYSLSVYTSFILIMGFLPEEFFEVINTNNPRSTVLFFPITLFLPVIFLSIRDGGKWEKLGAKASWAFALVSIIVASSRGALIPFIVISFMGFLYLFSKRKMAKWLVAAPLFSMLVAGLLFNYYNTEFVKTGIQTLLDGFQAYEIFSNRGFEQVRDLDRALHVLAAWDILTKNWFNLLFGYGYRVSGLFLAPKLEFLYAVYLPHLNFASELGDVSDVVTFGISAILADFGFVGLFGFITLFFVSAIRIVKGTRGLWRAILLVNLSFLVLRLYGNNFLTYPLFYLAFAPCGVFMYMIHYHRIINGVEQRTPIRFEENAR